jgi:hypothetical protein
MAGIVKMRRMQMMEMSKWKIELVLNGIEVMAWVMENVGRLQGSDQNHFPGWKRSHPLSWKSKRGNCVMQV